MMAFENLKKNGIKSVLTMLKDYFLQIKDALKSVNGNFPDENGNVQLDTVPFAQNLESESAQRSYGIFIQRMAGGEASISDGNAWLLRLKGNNVHDGFVEESIEWELEAVERANPITAAFDRATFVAYAQESGTTVLEYTTEWSENPALYGFTITGTPVDGDKITIVYVMEERGEISVANPQSMIATNWNLYNHTAGYARVHKYPDGYRVSGTYTSLQFSATESGSKSTIVVTDGNFDPFANSDLEDGFVWVNGGNSSDTAIYPTWEDWTEGYDGEFSAYEESEVDISNIMSTYFPYGLLKAGTVVDEIDLNLGQAISRVERMAYSEVNRATAAASGREYEFDESYIYLAKSTADTAQITVDGSFAVNDHGIEYFTGTTVPVQAEVLYGNNLKNKLDRDVLTVSQQTLTAAQKRQVHSNLGLASLIADSIVYAEKLLIDNKTISANSYDDVDIDASTIARTGYTPIGIIGYIIGNGSNSGTGSTFCSVVSMYITSGKGIKIVLRNHNSSQAKIKIYGEILYRKLA